MSLDIQIPNLIRKNEGFAYLDFYFDNIFENLERPGNYKSSKIFDLNIFLPTYSQNNAQYRQDFLSEWLDRSIRPELNKLKSGLPSKYIYGVSEYNPVDLWAEDNEERILQEINIVRKMICVPETLEEVAKLPGNSYASQDIRRFADKTRRDLNYFVRIVSPFKKDKNFTEGEDIEEEIKWANSVLERINHLELFFRKITNFRDELKHYENLAKPYELIVDGKRVPSCKPVFLDPDKKEGNIINAYNPRHFTKEYITKGHRRIPTILKLNVPNDIMWNSKFIGNYIHGPNSQGKSVYLDTIALNIHLAMNGSFCFADYAELSMPGKLFPCYDLGSVLGAGHFENGGRKIKEMLKKVRPNDIVFMDEVGSGTEPDAERKIARSLCDNLLKHSITFFNITHDKGSWIHNKEKNNVRMLRVADYEDKARKYKVWEGIAKDGYALYKARKLGIDPKSIKNILNGRFKKK